MQILPLNRIILALGMSIIALENPPGNHYPVRYWPKSQMSLLGEATKETTGYKLKEETESPWEESAKTH